MHATCTGVSLEILAQRSAQVAIAAAIGILLNSHADIN
jgi:hypothetical protein